METNINKTRLDNLIDDYITERVGLLKEKRRIELDGTTKYTWWEDENGCTIFTAPHYHSNCLGIYEQLWDLVSDLFNLGVWQTNQVFLDWVYNHLGLEFDDGIYKFYDPIFSSE